jgi:hypothetical protein
LTDNGGEPCKYLFRYGTSPGVYTDNTSWSADNKTTGQTFSANIGSLSPSTAYYYVAECKNSAGTDTGLERTFTTTSPPPTITTYPATSVMATTAILHGNLTFTGSPDTTVVIYSGNSEGGDNPGGWPHSDNLSVGAAGPFSLGVMGLTPGSPYYYRCYAENTAGGTWASSSAHFDTQTSLGLWRNYWEGPGKDWHWFSSGGP